MKEPDVLALLERVIAEHGGNETRAAAALGISRSYINDVRHGRRHISARLLKALGLAREIVIRRAKVSA